MGLDLGQDVRDVAVVVSANGEVDSSTVDTFASSLREALEAASSHPARKLVIELDGVTYFGSGGLNAVLACVEHGTSDGVAVRLVAGNLEVTRPIEVTKLDNILRPYKTIDDAIVDA